MKEFDIKIALYIYDTQQVIFKEELEYRNKYLNKQLNPKYM